MKNILIIRFSSFGDIILTTGIIKQIKFQRPNYRIDVLTSAEYAPIFKKFPYVRDIYILDKEMPLTSYIAYLKKIPKYDYIFDLHANMYSLIAKIFLQGKTATYNKNSIARRLFVKFKIGKMFLKKHVVEKYYDVVQKSLNLKQILNINELKPFIPNIYANEKQLAENEATVITIHPFASKQTKVWPHFHDLIKVLSDSGAIVNVIGIGDIEVSPTVNNLTGHRHFDSLVEIISKSDILISNDSGPMHLAAALNINLIAIFGSTTKELGFYPIFDNCKILEYPNLPCRPCHVHGLNECPLNDFSCMLSTSIEEVRFNTISVLSTLI